MTLDTGMALSFDGYNGYLRIAHDELVFPSQVWLLCAAFFCTNAKQCNPLILSLCFRTTYLASPFG